MRGKFRHESGVEIEIGSLPGDAHLVLGAAARKVFTEEGIRRLAAIIAGAWTLVEILPEHTGATASTGATVSTHPEPKPEVGSAAPAATVVEPEQ